MSVSIFNDVVGPVMRGPSSSHCAAANRMGRLGRDLMGGNITEVLVEYDKAGSLATTHESQGSDMGLFGGLMGMDTIDDRLVNSEDIIRDAGVQVEIQIKQFADTHPNVYRVTLSNETEKHCVKAISTGGGMIEIVEIDDVAVSIEGDFWETLIYSNTEDVLKELNDKFDRDQLFVHKYKEGPLIEIKSQQPLSKSEIESLSTYDGVGYVRVLKPVLPILSGVDVSVPFKDCKQLLEYNEGKELSL